MRERGVWGDGGVLGQFKLEFERKREEKKSPLFNLFFQAAKFYFLTKNTKLETKKIYNFICCDMREK